jgi:hypothetical protein
VVDRQAKPLAPVAKKYIKTYQGAYEFNRSSGRLGTTVPSQLSSKHDAAMLLLLQPIVLHSLKAPELSVKKSQNQNHWTPEDRLKTHQQQNMVTVVEEQQQPPAGIQQQSERTAKPVLVQNSREDKGCDLNSAGSHITVGVEATVAGHAEVSHPVVLTVVQAISRDQDLASTKLPAGSKQDQLLTCSSAAVATTGKRSWCRSVAVVASRIAAVVVMVATVRRHT